MKKPAAKKVNLETIFVGSEPVWNDPKKEVHLISALSWYTTQLTPKESKQYTLDFVKTNSYPKEILEKLSSSQDWLFRNLGFVCRIIQRGADIDKKEWIDNRIQEIINYVPSESISSSTNTNNSQQKSERNIQDRIFEQATVYINEIEGHVDTFIKEKSAEFKCYDWLKANDIKPVYAKQIENHYAPMLDELQQAYNKSDEQLVEAYSSWNRKDLAKFVEFIKNIISSCVDYTNNTKTVRKTRKKKAVPLEKKVASVKYKKEDSEYKIVSINPVEIIAAKQLWVFNSKYKTLGVYNSKDDSGFSIKGTTLEGFDETTSIQKTLRKPQEVLPLVTKGKKTELKKLMSGLSTKEHPLTGRLNEETVILKVIK